MTKKYANCNIIVFICITTLSTNSSAANAVEFETVISNRENNWVAHVEALFPSKMHVYD